MWYNTIMLITDVISEDYTIVRVSAYVYTTREHDSLRIWPNTNSFYWFSKNFGGSVKEWLSKVRLYSDEYIETLLEESEPDARLFFKKKNPVQHFETRQFYGIQKYIDYFRRRGLTIETVKKFSLEYDPIGRVIIPITNRENKRIGAIIRNIRAAKSNRYNIYANGVKPAIWPESQINFVNADSKIFLFEGCWSVMRWQQVIQEENVFFFAILGAYPSKLIAEYFNGLTVNVILDNDTTGKNLQNGLEKMPLKAIFFLPNIYPDEMSDEQIRESYRKICQK